MRRLAPFWLLLLAACASPTEPGYVQMWREATDGSICVPACGSQGVYFLRSDWTFTPTEEGSIAEVTGKTCVCRDGTEVQFIGDVEDIR